MHNIIAIDGGGTKTLTVLFQEDGHILYLRSDPGTNPLDIGVEASQNPVSYTHLTLPTIA